MSKTLLIMKREFSSRVKKRSFLIMTILGPILFAGMLVAPALLASLPEGPKNILVLDESRLLLGTKGDANHELRFIPPTQFDLDKAINLLETQDDLDALLHVPLSPSGDPDFWKKNSAVYGKEDITLSLENYLTELVETAIMEQKLLAENVDPAIVANARTSVNLKTFNLEESIEQESATEVKIVVGYAAGFFIYIFIFLYSAQIMRGVIEEKTNRIVEVLISSVKPFQLMSGKILGIGAVGALQFAIWVVLSFVFFQVASYAFLSDQLSADSIAQGQAINETGLSLFHQITSLPFAEISSLFLFFFIGGYLLYGSAFAAVGSAVDSDTDTQQFLAPLVIPLILGLIVSSSVIEDPHSSLSFWFSIFPLTSPIVMMVRIPFDVPAWELALSMTLLVLAFVINTWVAARIYRVGILLYGKKPTVREIWKWIRYNPS